MSVLDLEAELNTSRAETAAAKQERDESQAQVAVWKDHCENVVGKWCSVWHARSEALEQELDESNKARAIWADNAGKSADEVIRLKAEAYDLKAKLAKAVEVLTFVASSSMSTAHDCKQVARRGLAEIEGKSCLGIASIVKAISRGRP